MHDEPIYDDNTLECIMNNNRRDLIAQLWSYILSLEGYVVNLRIRINSLSGEIMPYPDPASDFALRFLDHPGFDEFHEILSIEDCIDPIRE